MQEEPESLRQTSQMCFEVISNRKSASCFYKFSKKKKKHNILLIH